MENYDLNERVKIALKNFLTADWKIIPSEDLEDKIEVFNKKETSIHVTEARNILWFARGLYGSIFFLKDFAIESKIPDMCKLPTEYTGALIVQKNDTCIFSTSWHGYEFIIVDVIKTNLCTYPISKRDVTFCEQIANIILHA
jgi:hypothetical protein